MTAITNLALRIIDRAPRPVTSDELSIACTAASRLEHFLKVGIGFIKTDDLLSFLPRCDAIKQLCRTAAAFTSDSVDPRTFRLISQFADHMLKSIIERSANIDDGQVSHGIDSIPADTQDYLTAALIRINKSLIDRAFPPREAALGRA